MISAVKEAKSPNTSFQRTLVRGPGGLDPVGLRLRGIRFTKRLVPRTKRGHATMRRFLFCLLPILAFLISCSDGDDQDPLWTLVPKGPVTADVMPVVIDQGIDAIGARFEEATRADWWDEYSEQYGNLPPHDPRMGISEDEYRQLIDHLTVLAHKTETVRFEFHKIGDMKARLKCKGPHPDFCGIEVDFRNDIITTPFGELTTGVRGGSGASPLHPPGPMVGTTWTLGDERDSGTFVQFAVGVRYDINKAVIFYRVRQRNAGSQPVSIDVLLHYGLEAFDLG